MAEVIKQLVERMERLEVLLSHSQEQGTGSRRARRSTAAQLSVGTVVISPVFAMRNQGSRETRDLRRHEPAS